MLHVSKYLMLFILDETLGVESMWSLALVVKSVIVATVDVDNESSSIPMLLQQQHFVESVLYLAQLGTGLSRRWIVKDLEVTNLVIVVIFYYSVTYRI